MSVFPSHTTAHVKPDTGRDMIAPTQQQPADGHDMVALLALPHLPYPKLRWPSSNWWLTCLSTLIGGLLFIIPTFPNLDLRTRTVAFIVLLATPAILLMVFHVLRLLCVFLRRGNAHADLFDTISILHRRAQAAEASLYTLLRADHNSFDIESCYNEGTCAFIEVRKKKGPALQLGADFCVLDSGDAKLMGRFRYVKEHGPCYVLQSSSFIDPLWLGDIIANKPNRAPLRAVAFLLGSTAGGTNEH